MKNNIIIAGVPETGVSTYQGLFSSVTIDILAIKSDNNHRGKNEIPIQRNA